MKPAGAYLDIIRALRDHSTLPIAAYQARRNPPPEAPPASPDCALDAAYPPPASPDCAVQRCRCTLSAGETLRHPPTPRRPAPGALNPKRPKMRA